MLNILTKFYKQTLKYNQKLIFFLKQCKHFVVSFGMSINTILTIVFKKQANLVE